MNDLVSRLDQLVSAIERLAAVLERAEKREAARVLADAERPAPSLRAFR